MYKIQNVMVEFEALITADKNMMILHLHIIVE